MVGLVLALMALGAVAPEPPHHREHVDVQAVIVDVHVTDRFGDFVSGLGAGDFEVYEDGVPQVIESLREVRYAAARAAGLPERASRAPESEPVAQAGPAPQPPTDPLPLRHFVFLLDLHNGVGNRGRDAVALWARENLRPEDRVTIATYLYGLQILVDDRPFSEEYLMLLRRASRAHKVRGFDPSLLLKVDAGEPSDGLDVQALLAVALAERTLGSRGLLNALRQLALRLEGRSGRKTVLLLSDGPAMDAYHKSAAHRRFREEIGPQFEAADATIYSIQTTGLSASSRGSGGSDLLYHFAYRTGGHHYHNTWNFGQVLEEVTREVGSYYQLSYTSRAPQEPGAFRKLEVVVHGERLQLRHKRGYTVPKDFSEMREQERNDALMSEVSHSGPAGELPARALLLPVPRGDHEAWLGVALALPGDALVPGADGDARLQLLAEVRNLQGMPLANLNLVLSLAQGADLEDARGQGLEWLAGLHLPRGRGTLRVVLRDEASGLTSSWNLPFDLVEPTLSVFLIETESGRLRSGDRESWPEGLFEFRGGPLHPRLDQRLVSNETIGLLLELPESKLALAKKVSLRLLSEDGSDHELEILGIDSERRADRVSVLAAAAVPELPAGPCLLEVHLRGEEAGHVAQLPLWCH